MVFHYTCVFFQLLQVKTMLRDIVLNKKKMSAEVYNLTKVRLSDRTRYFLPSCPEQLLNVFFCISPQTYVLLLFFFLFPEVENLCTFQNYLLIICQKYSRSTFFASLKCNVTTMTEFFCNAIMPLLQAAQPSLCERKG